MLVQQKWRMNDSGIPDLIPSCQLSMEDDGPRTDLQSEDTRKQALGFSDFKMYCFPKMLTHRGGMFTYRPEQLDFMQASVCGVAILFSFGDPVTNTKPLPSAGGPIKAQV